MTIGERIQMYRKELGLSQEELGQKLLVSRQTISLWEKDQTTPTLDNLIRLREIFGVSIDDILSANNATETNEALPNETYTFNFSQNELKEIRRLDNKAFYKRPIIFTIIFVLLILFYIASSAPNELIYFFCGIFLLGIIAHIKGIKAYHKAWKSNIDRLSKSTYEYKIFEDYIEVNIYRKNEKIRKSKCYFSEIEQIQQFDKWLFLKFGGQLYIIRKSDLKENSTFYSYMYKNPSKTVEVPIPNKWKVISVILFVAALLSPFGALVSAGTLSEINGNFTGNFWTFFLMLPIPLASIIFGYVLKAKGYKYKKNIIVGFIMAALLCIYGSFVFMF